MENREKGSLTEKQERISGKKDEIRRSMKKIPHSHSQWLWPRHEE